jgi:nitroreductase
MDLDEVMAKRRTIRRYLSIPVEKDKWGAILEVAKYTPSAGNLQDWKIIVVRSSEKREKIAHICHNQSWMASAPVHFIICADGSKQKYFFGKRGEQLYAIQDCACLMHGMMLKATDLGLSTAWVGAFDTDRLMYQFGIPPDFVPQGILTIGYGDEVTPAPPRCELRELVFYEQFGSMGDDFGNSLRFWRFGRAAKMVKDDTKQQILDIFGRILPKRKAKSAQVDTSQREK